MLLPGARWTYQVWFKEKDASGKEVWSTWDMNISFSVKDSMEYGGHIYKVIADSVEMNSDACYPVDEDRRMTALKKMMPGDVILLREEDGKVLRPARRGDDNNAAVGDTSYQLSGDEELLYDFNWKLYDRCNSLEAKNSIFVSREEKTTTEDGAEKRLLTLSNRMKIVEGIGCINTRGSFIDYLPYGINYGFDPYSKDDVFIFLLEYAVDGTVLWKNSDFDLPNNQTYKPILEEGISWTYDYHHYDYSDDWDVKEMIYPASFFLSGDTLINDIQYHKVMRSIDGGEPTYYCGMRETNGRVYKVQTLSYDTIVMTEEVMLLAYDTYAVRGGAFIGVSDWVKDEVDTVKVHGRLFVRHNYYDCRYNNDCDGPIRAVEGIGFKNNGLIGGMNYLRPTCLCDYMEFIACYENGECIFTNEDFDAQTYTTPSGDIESLSLMDDGKVWRMGNISPYRGNAVSDIDESILEGDTVINGVTFRQQLTRYKDSASGEYGELRPTGIFIGQDGKKVYRLDSRHDSPPRLLLDFSAQEGELISFTGYDEDQTEYTMRVTAVSDTVLTGSDYASVKRLCIYVKDELRGLDDIWVEGIGSLYYGIESNYPYPVTGSIPQLLECYDSNGVLYRNLQQPDVITGINSAKSSSATFDLQGRALNSNSEIMNHKLKPGIYVRDGKKFLVK